MMLTDHQRDVLNELLNISFARTAASLSELTQERVLLDAPRVTVRPLHEVMITMNSVMVNETATVHQSFAGTMAGDAFLLLAPEDAVLLTNLLTDEHGHSRQLDLSAREVLMEVGNILLNACLGTLGNILQMHISFSVPRFHIESLTSLLNTISVEQEGARYALVIYTSFRLRDDAVHGYLLIVVAVDALDTLLQALETLE